MDVSIRQLTSGPRYHWFGYYDKLQFDPASRNALGMVVDFEGRNPPLDDELPLLRNEVAALARFWIDSVYGEAMLATATPTRMVHLTQPLAQQNHLVDEVRKAKETMKESARG